MENESQIFVVDMFDVLRLPDNTRYVVTGMFPVHWSNGQVKEGRVSLELTSLDYLIALGHPMIEMERLRPFVAATKGTTP